MNPYLSHDYPQTTIFSSPNIDSRLKLLDAINAGLDLGNSSTGNFFTQVPGDAGGEITDGLTPWGLGPSIPSHPGLTSGHGQGEHEELDGAAASGTEPGQGSQHSSVTTILTMPTLSPPDSSSTSSTTPPDHSGHVLSTRQHRERNRIAARKCRQKTKQSISELQEHERDLHEKNKILLSHVASLKDEILYLKNEILEHSNCNSPLIQEYITNAARRQLGG
ncbi:hypothetical protein F5Y17DRAFT_478317 [Xylariaceae sp. FL0594]|nr:hypothetical protein F5Y17DRAFT_478317 [Xylariaceae sp. FL0594]